MERYFKYSDGVEYYLIDEGKQAKLIIKKDIHKIEIVHPDIGFLYETKERHVETFRKMIEKEEIYKLEKILKKEGE